MQRNRTPQFSDRIQNIALAQFCFVFAGYLCLETTVSQSAKDAHAFAALLPSAIMTASAGAMFFTNGERLSNAASAMFGAVKKGVQHVNAALGAPVIDAPVIDQNTSAPGRRNG